MQTNNAQDLATRDEPGRHDVAAGPPGQGIAELREMASAKQPASLLVLFDDRLFERVERAAVKLAKSPGICPPHLLGQSETIFHIILTAIDSGLAPDYVARNTFPVTSWDAENRRATLTGIGYMSGLMRARMEASGFFESIDFEYEGDWSKVTNKWKWVTPDKGKKRQEANYTPQDELGLAVQVVARLKKGREVRWSLEMVRMWPRNSTLWATDPKTQATYAALRRFCNLHFPHVLGGMTFEDDVVEHLGPEQAKDVTPQQAASAAAPARPASKLDAVADSVADAPEPEPEQDPEPDDDGPGGGEPADAPEPEPEAAEAPDDGRDELTGELPLADTPKGYRVVPPGAAESFVRGETEACEVLILAAGQQPKRSFNAWLEQAKKLNAALFQSVAMLETICRDENAGAGAGGAGRAA